MNKEEEKLKKVEKRYRYYRYFIVFNQQEKPFYQTFSLTDKPKLRKAVLLEKSQLKLF